MIDFDPNEQAVVLLLAPLRERGVVARTSPDEPGEVGFQVAGPGVVHVAIEAISKADHPSLDMKVQKRLYTILLDIRVRRRRGTAGLSEVSNHIDQLLQGTKVQGLGPLEFNNYKELGRTDSHWVAQMTFTCLRLDRR